MAPLPGFGMVDRDYGMRLAATPPDQDEPILVVNLMRYRDREAHGDRYTPTEVLADVGAEVVLLADVEEQLLGTPRWDRVACVLYPTRRSFISELEQKEAGKDAGMSETIVMGCVPHELNAAIGSRAGADWSDVPHPSTPDDGPVVTMHVLRFADDPDAVARMSAYNRGAAEASAREGGRIGGWYYVEGTMLGDGRRWDQVRCNIFPSKAAYLATVTDPGRVAAQAEHRDTALVDNCTMVLRPQINRLPGALT